MVSPDGMKQSPCRIRHLEWLLQPYFNTRLAVLAFPWDSTQKKSENLSQNFLNVSCSPSRLMKFELLLSTHNPTLWPNWPKWRTVLYSELPSQWKGPYTMVLGLHDVFHEIKNLHNRKEAIVHLDHLKPIIQSPNCNSLWAWLGRGVNQVSSRTRQ